MMRGKDAHCYLLSRKWKSCSLCHLYHCYGKLFCTILISSVKSDNWKPPESNCGKQNKLLNQNTTRQYILDHISISTSILIFHRQYHRFPLKPHLLAETNPRNQRCAAHTKEPTAKATMMPSSQGGKCLPQETRFFRLRRRLCPRVWVACARVASLKLKNISVYKSPVPSPHP